MSGEFFVFACGVCDLPADRRRALVFEDGYTEVMYSTSRIAEEVSRSLPAVLEMWRESRGVVSGEEEEYARLSEGMGRMLEVFTEFLRSVEDVETFSKGGATRRTVEEISRVQRSVGRDAVGVIEDYAALKRSIWRATEERIDLASFESGEVAGFFVKLMQASDWVTERGLQAFDEIVHKEMEEALGRAAATDLLTGLPDRDLFSRMMLPLALQKNERLSVAVFDVADFSETVAAGEVVRAREVMQRLSEVVRDTIPEGAACARFGDDEVCALLPDANGEAAYGVAETVLEGLKGSSVDFQVDVGIAEYPAHAGDAGSLVNEMLKALRMAKRVGGSGIVTAR